MSIEKLEKILESKNISKSFGSRKILANLDLKLVNGTIYTLMGANGAGKTTLFNIISGFLKPDKGTIIFKQKIINKLQPFRINRLGIARTFQDLRLIESLTVKENILLAFKGNKREKLSAAFFPDILFKNNQNKYDIKTNEIIQRICLENVINNKASELSYGQQKLLTIGCCIANEADLILLDEPVSGINQEFWHKIINLVKELKAENKTILLIEHNSDFINEVSDIIFFLSNGSVNVFKNYQSLKESNVLQEA